MREYLKPQESPSRVIQTYAPRQQQQNTASFVDNRDTVQMRLMDAIQHIGVEKEEPLQGKFETVQQKANNTGLPDKLKSGVESMSGISMDDVKVHYNSSKPAQMQAHAYTQGTDIHVAPGQEKHLPHEAWHVVQQKQGRVQPTMQMQGVNVNDNEGLEREADIKGDESSKTVQRMVLIAGEDINNLEDVVVLANLKYAIGADTGTMGINDMKNNLPKEVPKDIREPVHVIGHGSSGLINRYTGAEVGGALFKNNNSKEDGARWGDIEIYSCNAGIESQDLSLVGQIYAWLGNVYNNYTGKVSGRKGLALTHSAIGKRTVKPSLVEAYMALQESIIKEHPFLGSEDESGKKDGHLRPAGEVIITSLDTLSPLERACLIDAYTADFYKDLISQSASAGFLEPLGEGLKTLFK